MAAGAGVAFSIRWRRSLIAAIAAKEGVELWRGEDCECHPIPGLEAAGPGDACQDDCRHG